MDVGNGNASVDVDDNDNEGSSCGLRVLSWSAEMCCYSFDESSKRLVPAHFGNDTSHDSYTRFRHLLNEVDIVLVGGGGLFSYPHAPFAEANNTWQHWVRNEFPHVRFAFVSVGAHQHKMGLSDRVSLLLQHAHVVSGRDNVSVENLQHVCPNCTVYKVSDPVLALPMSISTTASKRRQQPQQPEQQPLQHPSWIGASTNTSSVMKNDIDDSNANAASSIQVSSTSNANSTTNANNTNIISTSNSTICWILRKPMSADIVEFVLARMNADVDLFMTMEASDDSFDDHFHPANIRLYNTDVNALYWNIQHNCDAVVTMRFHGAILSILAGKPIVGFVTVADPGLEDNETQGSRKLAQLFDSAGYSSCWFSAIRRKHLNATDWNACLQPLSQRRKQTIRMLHRKWVQSIDQTLTSILLT